MIFAVATLGEVFLYDTVQIEPFCEATDLHYACITDLAWYAFFGILILTTSFLKASKNVENSPKMGQN